MYCPRVNGTDSLSRLCNVLERQGNRNKEPLHGFQRESLTTKGQQEGVQELNATFCVLFVVIGT